MCQLPKVKPHKTRDGMLTLDRQARKALSSLSSSVTKLKAINAAFNAILDPSLSLSTIGTRTVVAAGNPR